jgi:nitroimidazol reductase NimA-like FMN-containing flavoprotein (pyridoxamine 5'-phosphate oxidase superfamily)
MSKEVEKQELWSERAQLKRSPHRGQYAREVLYPILDEAFFCHVGIVVESRPVVIPMVFGRDEDHLILHGAPASRLGQAMLRGTPVCVSVLTLVSIVLSKSVLNHTVNYRSAVVFGQATEIKDLDLKRQAAERLLEHVVPGRWEHCREPSIDELKGTRMLTLPLIEASTKIRSTPAFDEVEDRDLDFWAGEIPMPMVPGSPVPAPHSAIEPPAHATAYRRPAAAVSEPA